MNLVDREGKHWHRVADWLDPDDAATLVGDGAGWVVQWCSGGHRTLLEWADELPPNAFAVEVLPRVITRRKAQRLARKRSVPTVLVAEHWQDDRGRNLVVFHESGPAPRVL